MLGGLVSVNEVDVPNSRKLLATLRQTLPDLKFRTCADLGAGIGRVSMQVLSQFFEAVDLVEQNEAFLSKAQTVGSPGRQDPGSPPGQTVHPVVFGRLPARCRVRLRVGPVGHPVPKRR